MPQSQPLGNPQHPKRRRSWQSVPQSPPSASQPSEAAVWSSSPPPPPGSPPPASPPPTTSTSSAMSSPPYSVPSSSKFAECQAHGSPSGSSGSILPRARPRQPLFDRHTDYALTYGSDGSSDESEDETVAPFLPRSFRSEMETPMDTEDEPTEPEISEIEPLAHQPLSFFDFHWEPFPIAPISPVSRRERFSQSNVGPATPCVDPYDIFIAIWDRQFMEHIALETNRYAQQVVQQLEDSHNLHPTSRIVQWRDTNADELYVYFGIVLAMGVVVKSAIKEYWCCTPDIFYTPGFSAHMSYSRFLLLNKCIHFSNNKDMCALELDFSEAKLFKIRPVLTHLNTKFQSLYNLEQNVSLDESLLLWKGWSNINQVIPNKVATFGIKTYEVCESQTGYLWRFEVHTHKRSPPQQLEDPLTASTPAIVLRLLHGLENKGHTVWMDNFYNSPALARRLKTLGFDCVGTLRTNRKFVPQALHSLTKENMRHGQISGLTSGDIDVMVWRDSNRVAMLSTYHGNGVSRVRESTKPILILDYNIMMGGVDKKDQMLAMYPIERKRTKVWYKKLFRRLLNVSVLNSYIIHRKSSTSLLSSSLSHRNFRISLIKSLFSKHCSVSSIPSSLPSATSPYVGVYLATTHRLSQFPLQNHDRQRRRCKSCKKRVATFCVGCKLSMCMEPCFLVLHS